MPRTGFFKHFSLRFIKIAIIFIISSFITAGLSGCYLFPKEEKVLAPPLVEPPEITYDTIEVKKGDIEKRITGSGTFVSVSQENVYFKHGGGRIKAIHVELGDEVKEGDLLAELDTADLVSQIEQQKIAVKKLQLNYNMVKSRHEKAYEVEKKQMDLELAKSKLEKLQARLEAMKQLGDYVAQEDIEALQDEINRQKVEVRKIEMDYQQAVENKTNGYELKRAAMDLEVTKIQLDNLERKLEMSRLVSPIAGEVVYVDHRVSEGIYVEPYRTIIRIADPNKLQLQYSGSNYSDFKLGMEVNVKIKDKTYKGEVVTTPANIPIDAPDYMKNMVQIEVPNLPEDVSMGDNAQITLILDRREDVIVLPRNLVRNYMGRKYVLVLENGLKKERDVEVGLETPTEVEILKGLEVGEQVIVR